MHVCTLARLHDGHGKCCRDGVGEASETVAADEEDAGEPSVFEVREHGEPELGALGLLEPEAENLSFARQRHAQGHVNRLLSHGGAVANGHEKRVEVDDGIDGFERAALPRFRQIEDGVGHRADHLRRDVRAVDLLEKALDLAGRHPAGIERQDLFVEAREAAEILGNQFRREAAISVSRYLYREGAAFGFDGFFRVPVAAVGPSALLDLVSRSRGDPPSRFREVAPQGIF